MKKLKTEIKGFDALFHGGIQVDNLTSASDRPNHDSIIIVIRGEKGTHKHLLAMQLMHGLAKSVKNSLQEKRRGCNEIRPAKFYSINKSVQSLNDMFIDILIRRWIDAMTRSIKRRAVYHCADESISRMTIADNERRNALRFWFENDTDSTLPPTYKRGRIAQLCEGEIITLISDNLIYYNVRTNSLHFRRLAQGDSNDNLLYKRRHDNVAEYRKDFEDASADLKEYTESSESYSLEDELVKIEFYQDKKTDNLTIDRFSQKASKRFFNILHDIEDEGIASQGDNYALDVKSETQVTAGHTLKKEVIVIDGFSHIDDKSLKALPFDHLQDELRRKARISILVFDDRPDVGCDGDIVIDLRKSYDAAEDYSYSELQISKCTFQTHALGWHQYKRRDDGLVIFPSIHLLLTKRHYIPNMANDIGKGIFDLTYSQYAEAKLFIDNISGRLKSMREIGEKDSAQNMSNYANDFYYHDFNDRAEVSGQKLIDLLYRSQVKLRKASEDTDNYSMEYAFSETGDARGETEIYHKNLENTIFGSYAPDCYDTFGWSDHYASTAIVGNPNSFKRKLVLGHSFHWARKKEHVLFVLFDKNEEDLRRQMLCPGLLGKVIADGGKEKWDCKQCLHCYKFIHFFRIRSGCISSEEFFSTLLDQINIYCDEDPRYGIERRRLHIVIDDFQRIDFCFPFIKSSSLFTDALINICHDHNVDLTILCDKSGERAREVCTLSDNVICVERNQNDINRISLYIERTSNPPFPSAIMKYCIENVQEMFSCNSGNLLIDFEKGEITCGLVGSMKEYWRQTENAYIRGPIRLDSDS